MTATAIAIQIVIQTVIPHATMRVIQLAILLVLHAIVLAHVRAVGGESSFSFLY